MKYLIVNADDFGQTSGINRGIVEAHLYGIVTSTSLMVDQPGAEEAARLAAGLDNLSVGLHASITDEYARPTIDLGNAPEVGSDFGRSAIRAFERSSTSSALP